MHQIFKLRVLYRALPGDRHDVAAPRTAAPGHCDCRVSVSRPVPAHQIADAASDLHGPCSVSTSAIEQAAPNARPQPDAHFIGRMEQCQDASTSTGGAVSSSGYGIIECGSRRDAGSICNAWATYMKGASTAHMPAFSTPCRPGRLTHPFDISCVHSVYLKKVTKTLIFLKYETRTTAFIAAGQMTSDPAMCACRCDRVWFGGPGTGADTTIVIPSPDSPAMEHVPPRAVMRSSMPTRP